MFSFEHIYSPAFFDVMIHLVIHLPEEAILGGPTYYRWMYPFERYMKKLKNYVRNKAKLEGSIAEGYVAEEALTFCSRYLKGVETRFNRRDRNEHGLNPTDKFQKSKQTSWRTKSKFPNNNAKEEFPPWFDQQIRQRSVENDPVCAPELLSLACGPSHNEHS
ncbi:hypothetical protein Tco_1307197 [Tanacetum coccineum]